MLLLFDRSKWSLQRRKFCVRKRCGKALIVRDKWVKEYYEDREEDGEYV